MKLSFERLMPMPDRLVVHAHVPKSGSGMLNRTVFLRNFTRRETMLAYGDAHGQVARLPGTNRGRLGQRLERVSVAMGHVPYGYFDGFGRWTIYVSVFEDPVKLFLNQLYAANAKRTVPTDPEQQISLFLACSDTYLHQRNMMTRIAAGLPAFGVVQPERRQLDVACANVLRSNYLVTTRERMPAFERHLADVLGVAHTQTGPSIKIRHAPDSRAIKRADLSARLLRRIEAANELDMHLFDAVLAQNEVCWA